MQKYWFIPIFGLAAAVIGLWVVFAGPLSEKQEEPPVNTEDITEAVHYHAGFQVYVDDELLHFSDFRYMSVEPCAIDEGGADAEVEHETVDLHNGVGDVIHVHAENMTWRNVAEYINEMGGHGFTEADLQGLKIEAYVNGERVEGIEDRAIREHDSVVIFVGANTKIEDKLASRVTEERIIEIDNSNDGCGL